MLVAGDSKSRVEGMLIGLSERLDALCNIASGVAIVNDSTSTLQAVL